MRRIGVLLLILVGCVAAFAGDVSYRGVNQGGERALTEWLTLTLVSKKDGLLYPELAWSHANARTQEKALPSQGIAAGEAFIYHWDDATQTFWFGDRSRLQKYEMAQAREGNTSVTSMETSSCRKAETLPKEVRRLLETLFEEEVLTSDSVALDAASLYHAAYRALPAALREEGTPEQGLLAKAFRKGRGALSAGERARLDEVVAESQPALVLFLQAGDSRTCQWEIDISKGPEVKLSYLLESLRLAFVAVARMEALLEGDQQEEGLALLGGTLQLAQRVSAEPLVLAGALLHCTIEERALEAVSRQRSRLDNAGLLQLRALIATLGAPPSMAAMVSEERRIMREWVGRDRAKAEASSDPRAELQEMVEVLLRTPFSKRITFRKQLSMEQIEALLNRFFADYEKLDELAQKSSPEDSVAFDAFLKSLHNADRDALLSKITLSMFAGIFQRQERVLELSKALSEGAP